MPLFAHFDLWSVGVAMAGIGLLGYVTYLDNKESATHRAFFMLSVTTILWSLFNYFSYNIHQPAPIIWVVRVAVFFAVWYAYSVFRFCFIFPESKLKLPNWHRFFVVPATAAVSVLNLTPWVFTSVGSYTADGRVATVFNGPAVPLFGLAVFALNGAGIWMLLKKMRHSEGVAVKQIRLILAGLVITLSLITEFNFIFPALLNNTAFISFGALFVFPFIAFTAYAIFKHKLLDVKVVSTEVLSFVLVVTTLFEIFFSRSVGELVYRFGVFFLLLGISLMLIKSVRKEIEQKEQLADIATSLERANLRLQELDKQKTEFLSIASHQLRTPLSIIKGYIELIEDGAYGKPTKALRETLGNMDETNERLVKLIDEFLDISRIEQGRTKFNFSTYKIDDVVESVVKEITDRAKDKGLSLEWKPGKLGESIMDEEKIRHVVFNFVDNAIKYSEKGTINVSIAGEKNGIAVRVKDEGLGFNKADEASFYQKFYRGENVKGVNVGGTGLGLYVCRKFIESHGGRVWAKSEGLGKGGEFGFWIPKNPPPQTNPT